MKNKHKFYMWKCDDKGFVANENDKKDLEKDFDGLLYSQASGLDSIGTPRTYAEEYAESDRARVYLASPSTASANKVTFTFYFVGENRRAVMKEFIDYITDGFHRYYDDARKKYFYFYVASEINNITEQHYGSVPNTKLVFEAKGLFGRTFDTPI